MLVQTIKINFCDEEPWTDGEDIRPYGNFFIDTDKSVLYAYTLRDALHVTRFFRFDLPKISDGDVNLNVNDIREQFDIPYIPYVQGNAYCNGKVLICSGGTGGYTGKINVIVLTSKFGIPMEPEFIDVYNGHIIFGELNARMLFT